MGEPKSAGRFPHVGEMETGTYYWCQCGQSLDQPFCDGSHKKAGEFSPVPIEITEKKIVALCMCKKTGNAPLCDGSHKTS